MQYSLSNDIIESAKKLFIDDNNFEEYPLMIQSVLDNIIFNDNISPNDPRFKKKSDKDHQQLVIKSIDSYYKIYHVKKEYEFDCRIREIIADIYKNTYGIDWEIKTYHSEDSTIYQIEKRQALKVCHPNDYKFEDILVGWSKTLDLIEHRLNTDVMLYNIMHKIPGIRKIKLIRDVVNSFNDYAIFRNHVILLDDEDFQLCFLDEHDNIMSCPADYYRINSFVDHPFYIGPKINDGNINGVDIDARHLFQNMTQWYVYYDLNMFENLEEKKETLQDLREQMASDNVKILSRGNSDFMDHALYYEYSKDDDFSYSENLGSMYIS